VSRLITPSRPARRRLGALLVGVGIAMAAVVAAPLPAAQAQGKKARDPKATFAEGQAAFAEGRFVEAGIKFLEAFELDPHPAILYNAGRAFEESGELIKALGYYRQALGLNPTEKIEQELAGKIKEIELFLRAQGIDVLNLDQVKTAPKGLLTIKTDPPGAEVLINNLPVGVTPLEEHGVPQGAYTIELRKRGFSPVYRDLTVIAGKTYVMAPALRPEEETATARRVGYVDVSAPRRGLMVFVDGEPAAETPVGGLEVEVGEHRISVESVEGTDAFPTWEQTITVTENGTIQVVASWPKPVVIVQEDTSLLTNTGWGIAVASLGGASLATGLVFGVSALGDASEYNNRRSEFGRATWRDSADSNALVADVFYGVGVALVTTGVVLIVLDDGAEANPAYDGLVDRRWHDLLITPTVLEGGGGVGAHLTW